MKALFEQALFIGGMSADRGVRVDFNKFSRKGAEPNAESPENPYFEGKIFQISCRSFAVDLPLKAVKVH